MAVSGGSPSFTTITTTSDASISGLTVGKGGGAVATNTAVGASAIAATATGVENVAVGQYALTANTTGQYNVAVGRATLYSNVSGNQNTAVGRHAVFNNTASDNTGVGFSAMGSNTTGASNVAVGSNALQANTTASNNTAVGYQAGYTNTTGTQQTSFGYLAGYASTGNYCTFIGGQAGQNTTGNNNTFIGQGSAASVTTGAKNTVIGMYSGNQGGLDIRTASNNIVLSDGDGNPRLYCNSNGRWSMNGGTNNNNAVFHVYSGSQDPDIQMGSNTDARDIHLYMVNSTRTSELSQLGNSLVARCGGSGGVTLTNGSTSWAAYSDSRLKDVTGTYTNALADIAQLEPVKFTWKSDEDKKPCVGLIAQSVEKVVPEAIDKVKKPDYKETGDETEYLSVRYTELIPLMVASIQELKTIVDAQAAELDTVKAELAALKG
jgi:hypothetical protein